MDSTKGSSVAIVLLNWNGLEFTLACLESLGQIIYPNFTIILVENGSTDGSYEELTAKFPDMVILKSEINLGFTGGNNKGMEYAMAHGYDYVLLLNNDTVVEKDFLGYLVKTLDENDEAGAVQPLIYFLNEPHKIWNAGGSFVKWLNRSKTWDTRKFPDRIYKTDWITGCAMLVKADVIKKTGNLDDRYFAYFEDVDWSLRIREAGFGLWVNPLSCIYHEAGAASKSKEPDKEGYLNPKVHYLNVRNQIFQLRKYGRFPYGLVAWPFQMIKILFFGTYFLVRRRWEKLRATWRGLVDGIGMNLEEK